MLFSMAVSHTCFGLIQREARTLLQMCLHVKLPANCRCTTTWAHKHALSSLSFLKTWKHVFMVANKNKGLSAVDEFSLARCVLTSSSSSSSPRFLQFTPIHTYTRRHASKQILWTAEVSAFIASTLNTAGLDDGQARFSSLLRGLTMKSRMWHDCRGGGWWDSNFSTSLSPSLSLTLALARWAGMT